MKEKDPLDDMRMARWISVCDVWDIEYLIDRFEALVDRLEVILKGLSELYRCERVKNLEETLKSMIEEKEEVARGNRKI